jgi:hypothetical protein
MRYATPGAFRAALEARVNRQALTTGQGWLVRQRKLIVFERLMARLLLVAPDAWVLKGAVALNLRFGERARATKDLDLARQATEAAVASDLSEAEFAEIGDFFSFVIERTDVLHVATEGAAIRYRVQANLANRRFETFTLDVGIGNPGASSHDLLQGPGLLEFAGILPITIPVVTLDTHVAEKLHAYVHVYANGRRSSRAKDLVDLVLIRSAVTLEAKNLRSAITRTFGARGVSRLPRELPAPPSDWRVGYSQMAEEIGLEPDLLAGHRLAAELLDPVLDGSAPDGARWNPQRGAWSAPDTPAEVP